MRAKIGNRLLASLKPQAGLYEVWDDEIPGFLLVVRPTGRMTYYCSYRRKNKRRTRITIGLSTVFTPAQARNRAKEILADVAKGLDPQGFRPSEHILSLHEYLKNPYGPWAESHLKTGTAAIQRIENRFKDFLAKPLNEIYVWAVEKWSGDRIRNGVEPITINRDVSTLKAALSKAVEWNILEAHPLAGLKPLKVDAESHVRYLDIDEESRLRDALDTREAEFRDLLHRSNALRVARGEQIRRVAPENFMDHLKPMVLLCINTGIRRGELFQIRYQDLNLPQRLLTIPGGISKSKKTRHIPLNDEAYSTLKIWKEQTPSQCGLIFPNAEGKKLDTIKTSWGKLLERAKITNFRFHDLRHHFASRLVMAGVDLNTVRELLGHADIAMTLRYAHLAPHIKAQAVAKLTFARVVPISNEKTDHASEALPG